MCLRKRSREVPSAWLCVITLVRWSPGLVDNEETYSITWTMHLTPAEYLWCPRKSSKSEGSSKDNWSACLITPPKKSLKLWRNLFCTTEKLLVRNLPSRRRLEIGMRELTHPTPISLNMLSTVRNGWAQDSMSTCLCNLQPDLLQHIQQRLLLPIEWDRYICQYREGFVTIRSHEFLFILEDAFIDCYLKCEMSGPGFQNRRQDFQRLILRGLTIIE